MIPVVDRELLSTMPPRPGRTQRRFGSMGEIHDGNTQRRFGSTGEIHDGKTQHRFGSMGEIHNGKTQRRFGSTGEIHDGKTQRHFGSMGEIHDGRTQRRFGSMGEIHDGLSEEEPTGTQCGIWKVLVSHRERRKKAGTSPARSPGDMSPRDLILSRWKSKQTLRAVNSSPNLVCVTDKR